MSAMITDVERRSPAARAGIRPGDRLMAINGRPVRDVLDYKFYTYDTRLSLELEREGAPKRVLVKKAEGEDLGLVFETYLMDAQKSCSNKCVFCFIDQLAPNMRSSLYFKDDDARLSFLLGNYISMTNLSDGDVDRMIAMRVSPLNISVHTTNPDLRCRMLGNRFGGDSLRHLRRFVEAGMSIKGQIVVCPGYNDGDELRRSLADLAGMYPAMRSVSVVPVGLTRFRQGLAELQPVTADDAREIIGIVDAQRKRNLAQTGQALCYASDELYLKAGLPLPDCAYYEDFAQLENGVGMLALFEDELSAALELEEGGRTPPPFTAATGLGAAPFLTRMIDGIGKKCDNLSYQVCGVRNDFFGHEVTVAGLVTGGDLIAQLRGKELGQRLLLPACMLRHGETVFLDDVSLEDVERALGVPVRTVENDGGLFLDAVLGR